MNNEQRPDGKETKKPQKRSARFYIQIGIIYALILLLLIFVINYDSFSKTIGRFLRVVMPIFYGFLIAYLCNPLLKIFLEKAFVKIRSVRWRKILSLICTYLTVFLLIFAILFIVIQQTVISVQDFIDNMPKYISQTEKAIVDFINNLPFLENSEDDPAESTVPVTDGSGQAVPNGGTQSAPADTVAEGNETSALPATDTEGPKGSEPHPPFITDENGDRVYEDTINLFDLSFTKQGIIKWVKEFFSDSEALLKTVGNSIVSSSTAAVEVVVNILLGFILSAYILADKDHLLARARKLAMALFGQEKGKRILAVASYSNETIGRFIQGKLLESLIFGCAAYILFLCFGIPNALMIAVLVAIMNLVPIFGPFLGAIPAGFLVLLSGDIKKTIIYVAIIIVLTQINGNYISPRITGNRTGLTAFGSITALLLMSGYFGVIGMFIGIPIFAVVIKLISSEMDKRLADAGLSQEIEDYYSPEALGRLKEYKEQNKGNHPHNLVGITVDGIKALFDKIFRRKKKNKS